MRRNLVIGLVVTVPVATAVILLAQGLGGVKESDEASPLPTVLVSNRDIQAGQQLDRLIEEGVFMLIAVPEDALIVGAITDLEQLTGTTAVVDIQRHHQISANHVERVNPLKFP